MDPLTLIVAMTPDRVIGVDGGLPWHISEDLKHFRRNTVGHSIIMGRKTYESIGRPLPKRRNIIVTRNQELDYPDCEVVHGIEAALELARATDSCPVVIGGATLYEAYLPYATRLLITEVRRDVAGDTFFPRLAAGTFVETHRERAEENDDVDFITLERQLVEI